MARVKIVRKILGYGNKESPSTVIVIPKRFNYKPGMYVEITPNGKSIDGATPLCLRPTGYREPKEEAKK